MNRAEALAILDACDDLEKTYNGDYSEPDGVGGWRIVYTKARYIEAKNVARHSAEAGQTHKGGRPEKYKYLELSEMMHRAIDKHGPEQFTSIAFREYRSRFEVDIEPKDRRVRGLIKDVAQQHEKKQPPKN